MFDYHRATGDRNPAGNFQEAWESGCPRPRCFLVCAHVCSFQQDSHSTRNIQNSQELPSGSPAPSCWLRSPSLVSSVLWGLPPRGLPPVTQPPCHPKRSHTDVQFRQHRRHGPVHCVRRFYGRPLLVTPIGWSNNDLAVSRNDLHRCCHHWSRNRDHE
jgi:hypothetical protein